jgi:hypothetical protein
MTEQASPTPPDADDELAAAFPGVDLNAQSDTVDAGLSSAGSELDAAIAQGEETLRGGPDADADQLDVAIRRATNEHLIGPADPRDAP